MKRLKEYINEHPKLKRVVKILGVVAIVFSFLFNALIIGSLIITANKDKINTKTLVYSDTPITIRNVIQDRFIAYYSIADFMSPLFAEETYNYLTSSDISQIGTSGYNYQNFLNGDTISINATDMLYATLNSTGDNINVSSTYSVPRFVVYKLNNYTYPAYSISFDFQNGNTIYRYNFFYARYTITNSNNEVTYFNWSSSSTREYSTNGGSSFNGLAYAQSNIETYFAIPKNQNFNWIGTGEAKLNDYYNRGYDSGYQTGKEYGESVGYDDGYGDGYYEGLQAGQEGETTMFSLITGAFNSIAAILDIQILPNLSLGLLIFTPLIVTIIIVVVKMVKG